MDMNNNQGFNPNDMNNGGYQPDMNNGMNNMNNINNMNNMNNMNNIPKKKGGMLKIVIPIVAVILLLVIIIAIVSLGGKDKGNEEVPENPVVTETQKPTEDGNKPVEELPSDEEPKVETSVEDIKAVTYSYDDPMIGIKFNFASNLYSKYNTEEVFNTLHTVIPEDRNNFNIYLDKLPKILNLVKLTTGDNDSLFISVSLLAFEVEQKTTTLKANGETEVKKGEIAAINLTDEELISQYDKQLKKNLEEAGCVIETYNESKVGIVGKDNPDTKLKGIFTSRVYTGPVDKTTETGKIDVLQCTIPVGENAILITAATDGSPIEINKEEIFNQIVDSMVVVTENPADLVEEKPAE